METLAISFTSLCQCLSEETLKAVRPFNLVSMSGEVKDPTQGVNVYCEVPNSCAVWNNSVGWKIHPN